MRMPRINVVKMFGKANTVYSRLNWVSPMFRSYKKDY